MFWIQVLALFAGVCSWLISKQKDISRMARLSLLANPLLLILALMAFSYSVMLKGFYCDMYHEFFEQIKISAMQQDAAVRQEISRILAKDTTSIEERLNRLILYLETKKTNPDQVPDGTSPGKK